MSEQNASKLPKLDRDEATSTSRKRNAFSELMSPKPKQRSLPTQMDKPTKAAFKQFGDGLGIYIQDPKAHASQVVLENSDFVVIHDLFPKASIHLLILPRDAGKYRQHPFEAFEDSEFLAKVRKQAFDVKSLAAKELRRKFGKNSAQDQDRERAMQSDDVDAELPPGRDWESEIMTPPISLDMVEIHLPPKPIGLKWRSNTLFILITVAIGLFTDLFLYGLIVPILPFLLRDRVDLPQSKVQSYVSGLLAAYAGASVVCSLPAGYIADKVQTRRAPFLGGLIALLAATVMLAFGQNVPVLVVARVLQGISAAFVWTVGLAMVLDTVGPGDLGKVIGSLFSFISIGELAAPVLGGVLYEKTGYGGVFGIGAALLGVDFILRVLVIEKRVAALYLPLEETSGLSNPNEAERQQQSSADDQDHDASNGTTDEQTPLLHTNKAHESSLSKYKIPSDASPLIRKSPILYCLTNPRLPIALLLAFVQATLLATFDATIPTEAQSLFKFTSLRSGLLFIALDIPYLLLGPLAGWAVDKYGTKPAAVLGFAYLVPCLILLRLPNSSSTPQIILYSALLALNGVGLAIIGSPSIVEASHVVQQYDKANPGVFGDNGPYAQLYGLNSLVFSAGLTIGPILAGTLRDKIGYGNMNVVMAIITGVTAMLSFWFVGGRPRGMRKLFRK
ncbi:putative membrane transporter [Phaeomoniella chlamydospora]|uniref:Putative membrane transporter n=1 Tax=Phaeomoniella chlamydospora TaxID=158046 RepID=A0A0G2GWZ2_PHACM|nr:putative membrane transporter [Phaeomoniella chlamydospora]